MYEDDTAISFSSDNIEEIDAVLNAELACLEKWLQGNKFSLNVVKTQAMIIGSLQKSRKIDTPMVPIPHFQVNGNDINLVKETKYLSLMIDDNVTGGPFDTPATPLLQRLGWLSIDKLIY